MNIYPKDYFASSLPVKSGTCFVIMPFAQQYHEVYAVIKEATESDEIQLECKRADDFLQPHILGTILENIAKAEYIIADLTGQNANVFYELGIAHCIKEMNKLILLTQDMKDVPFDLRQYRCIEYEQTITGAGKLRKDLINTFKNNIGNQFTFTLEEDEQIHMPEKITGNERYLYSLSFTAPAIGNGASKLQIRFSKHSAWGTKETLDDQYLHLYPNEIKKVNNVPWVVRLNRAGNGKAIFTLQQIGQEPNS